jgi:2,3-dihydroxyphenylpropionate 1,2-dioxygenase
MPDRLLTVCASHSPGMARDDEASEGTVFRQGLDRARAIVENFRPDLAVIFGTDHRRTFTNTTPAFAVVQSATALGDLGSPSGRYEVPSELTERLASNLLADGLDVALCRDVALDHGFGQTFGQLLGAIDAIPTVPIFINCATPPLPTMARVQRLGEQVGIHLANAEDPTSSSKILIIGSGGLSHAPPSLAPNMIGACEEERAIANRDGRTQAAARISEPWDQTFLAALPNNDSEWLQSLEDTAIDGGGWGAHECRTWVAAHAFQGEPLQSLAYEAVPEWITGMGLAATRT